MSDPAPPVPRPDRRGAPTEAGAPAPLAIAVIGIGYVGLVAAACLADAGHTVTCIDRDGARLEVLRAGVVPIHEPGLDEVLTRALAARRLRFHDTLAAAADADVVLVTVGTPRAMRYPPKS